MGDGVADEDGKTPGPFDVKTVKSLVGLMSQHDLSEIDLREGDRRICLRRGPRVQAVAAPALQALPAPAAPAPAPTPAAATPAATSAPSGKEYKTIKSPTPGTFYTAASPDAEPFVRVGSRVSNDTVVCIIEAMKIFNEITADTSGVIAEVLVQNQQPVEYGQVLFKVDPAG